MIFGLPWFAIIPIVAIVGGLFLEYRKQELKYEQSSVSRSRELQEIRKLVHSLKARIENLEAIVTSVENEKKSSYPLDDLEIKDERNSSERSYSSRKSTHS